MDNYYKNIILASKPTRSCIYCYKIFKPIQELSDVFIPICLDCFKNKSKSIR